MNSFTQVAQNLEPPDLAWAAGIIDGEGWIGITPTSKPTKDGFTRYQIRLEVGNTSLLMLNELQAMFRGCINLRRNLPHANSKPLWKWCTTSRTTYEALQALLPYLRIKQEQARLVIEFYEVCKTQKPVVFKDDLGRIIGRTSMTAEQATLRANYYNCIRELNHRGLTYAGTSSQAPVGALRASH